MTPPPSGSAPAEGKTAIICEALASTQVNGMQFGDDASEGMAVGYGLVTVSQTVPTNEDVFDETGMPRPPASPPLYDHRLAWVVVVEHQQAASCPDMPAQGGRPVSASTTVQRLPAWHYSVFLADGRTGADSLVYTEAAPPACGGSGVDGPYRSIPVETISVPWKLVSRDPDGYSGRIEAQVPPCWTAPTSATVERSSNTVQVAAFAIAGETCGALRPVTLTLDADTVFDDLPTQLVPAPVGPVVEAAETTPPTTPPTPPESTGQIVQLTRQESGTTLTVRPGDVLAAAPPLVPLPSPSANSNSDRIRSSNPAVVGQLAQSAMSLPEFRAWEPGRAVLSDSTGWSVTVVVAGK